jgi:hypothetical protein
MTNILFRYMYRDGSNNKQHNHAVFANAGRNTLAEIEARLRAALEDGRFKAEMVELETCFFGGEPTEDDHPWHEFVEVAETDLPPCDPASCGPRDISEFVRALEDWKQGEKQAAARKKKRRKSVIVRAALKDWNLLEETLAMDAESAAFEPALRRDICRALHRLTVEEV